MDDPLDAIALTVLVVAGRASTSVANVGHLSRILAVDRDDAARSAKRLREDGLISGTFAESLDGYPGSIHDYDLLTPTPTQAGRRSVAEWLHGDAYEDVQRLVDAHAASATDDDQSAWSRLREAVQTTGPTIDHGAVRDRLIVWCHERLGTT